MKYNYSNLQNGSDIRGVALENNKGLEVNLTEETVSRIGRAYIYKLMTDCGIKPTEMVIAIGRDSRLSGENILSILSKEIVKYGVKVLDCGLSSTPAMFMATVFEKYKCISSIMITASHLPRERNGFKFFTREGGFDKKDIVDIVNFAESDYILNQLEKREGGLIETVQLMEDYSSHLREIIKKQLNCGDRPLENLKITVDAGNGAGGFFATKVLQPLGADVSSSQFLDPDGNFPNHIPNPENKEAMESIKEEVKSSKSDLGIIFDTDVDRASAVDERGEDINRNKIVALASILVSQNHPNTTVVTDSITSSYLTKFLEEDLGLHHLRYKRGYKNVINKSRELMEEGVDSHLAIETSGHCAFADNYYLDDGAYLATQIVIKTAELKREGKNISSLIENLRDAEESCEYRLKIDCEAFVEYGEKIIEGVRKNIAKNTIENAFLSEPNYEGVKVEFEDLEGWFLMRLSLHEPLLVINIESGKKGGLDIIKCQLEKILVNYTDLDISEIQ